MAGNSVKIFDKDGVPRGPNWDKLASVFTSLTHEHHEIHEGKSWVIGYSATKDAAESIEVLIQTKSSNKHAHMLFLMAVSAGCDAYLYEGTTKTYVVGNALTLVNRNRNYQGKSGHIPVAVIQACHTPGGSGDGTAILTRRAGAFKQAGDSRSIGEIILKQDTDYLVRITADGNGTDINLQCDWYEEIDSAITTTTTTTTTSTTTSSTTTSSTTTSSTTSSTTTSSTTTSTSSSSSTSSTSSTTTSTTTTTA